MTASVVRPEVLQFVREVRAALGDLAPEEVDELTEGLAADLSESGGEVASLGDPAAYAAELRAAAGLPPRAAGPRGSSALAAVAALDHRVLDGVRAWLDDQRWWPAIRDFLVVLRPVWWVARAWAAWQVLLAPASAMGHVLPRSGGSLLVLGTFVVASVQLGRHAGGHGPGRRLVSAAVNVVTVLCLSVALSLAAAEPEPADGSPQVGSSSPEGLWANGEPVRDVFAYDGQGRLIPVVQLYDQDGRPLDLPDQSRVVPAEGGGMDRELAPVVNADGRQLWNVYPVHGAGRNAPPFRSVAPVTAATPTPRH